MSTSVQSSRLELYDAARRGDAEAVQQLLAAAKAAGTLQEVLSVMASPDKSTALHTAALTRNPTVVRLLLEAGAAVDAQTTLGKSPLHYAACSNKPEVLKLLLAAGANVDQQTRNGATAVYLAAQHNDCAADALQVLVRAGAAAAAVDAVLCKAAGNGLTAVVRAMLSAGAKADVADACGWTALHHAVWREHPATVQELLIGGAALDAADIEGSTPLSLAAYAATRKLRSEVLACFLNHTRSSPAAPAVMIKAAAAAAVAASKAHLIARSIDGIRQLLSAAIQQDIGAACAALQQHWPLAGDYLLSKPARARLACMWLDMWLAAADDQAGVEAALPAVQQMVVQAAAALSASGEQAAGEVCAQKETCSV